MKNLTLHLFFVSILLPCLIPSSTDSYSIDTLCSSDADCPSATETYCNRLKTVSPACQKGYCVCRPGYVYDGSTACLQLSNLTIGQGCNSAVNERYTFGAGCNASFVSCSGPYYIPLTPTRCVQIIVQPIYDNACSISNATLNCNASLNFGCSASTNKCTCTVPTMIYKSSQSSCTQRIYGDTCSAQADCDSGSYTNLLAASGGPDCISNLCGCATGFTAVQRVSYDGTTKSLITTCLKGHTANLVQNASCNLLPEQSSASGALVCSTNFACIRCPEDTTAPTNGICRAVIGASCSAIQTSSLGSMSPDQVVTAIKSCGGQSGQDALRFDPRVISCVLLLIPAIKRLISL